MEPFLENKRLSLTLRHRQERGQENQSGTHTIHVETMTHAYLERAPLLATPQRRYYGKQRSREGQLNREKATI